MGAVGLGVAVIAEARGEGGHLEFKTPDGESPQSILLASAVTVWRGAASVPEPSLGLGVCQAGGCGGARAMAFCFGFSVWCVA